MKSIGLQKPTFLGEDERENGDKLQLANETQANVNITGMTQCTPRVSATGIQNGFAER